MPYQYRGQYQVSYHAGMHDAMTIGPAAAKDLPAVLALAFARLGPVEAAVRAAAALDLIATGALDAGGILTACQDGRVTAAMVAAPLPGAGAVVWPPQAAPGADDAAADALARYAADWLR